MHHYPFHIGDYRSSTAHLTNEEDLAYRRLIDFYMDTEQEIPLETHWVARRIRVSTEDVETVLNDFFLRTETGWKHERCDHEIEKYQKRVKANQVNGLKGGRPKGKNPVVTQSKPKRTLTKNQEPRTNTTHKCEVERPTDVEVQVWDDFLKHRKRLRADVTTTALNGIIKEAKKAGIPLNTVLTEMVTRGWRGFKAEWLDNEKKSSSSYTDGVEIWN